MQNEDKSILIVDSDLDALALCSSLCASRKYKVLPFQSPQEALHTFAETPANVALIEWELPQFDGGELAKRLLSISTDLQVIIFTAYSQPERVQESQQIGVFDFISKPVDNHELLIKVEKAFQRYDSIIEKRLLEEENERMHDSLLGKNPLFVDTLNRIFAVAQTDATILLQGETGTGKELVARAIHRRSRRCNKPFVIVNCPAITDTILESAFFGHERGAFTGAISQKKGYFEEANEGTIFLDEMGDLSAMAQAALLRVLEGGEISRVGSTKTFRVNVRVIAATNRQLVKMVDEEHFRSDLFFRLNILPFLLPPLRDRKDDVPLLADYFAKSLAEKPIDVSNEAKQKLMKHDYPGNVRELKNIILRALQNVRGTTILPSHIVIDPNTVPKSQPPESGLFEQEWSSYKSASEEQYLRYWLEKCSGNVTEMSKRTKRDRSDLYGRLKAFGLL